MKKFGFILLLVVGVYLVWNGQQEGASTASFEDGGSPYVTSGSALSELPELLAKSTLDQKPLILLFTGSTWCPPCQQLAKAVLKRPEWESFVREQAIFVVYDFPRSGAPDGPAADLRNRMAQQFGVEGFPTLLKLDTKGAVVQRQVGYSGMSAEDYIQWARQ